MKAKYNEWRKVANGFIMEEGRDAFDCGSIAARDNFSEYVGREVSYEEMFILEQSWESEHEFSYDDYVAELTLNENVQHVMVTAIEGGIGYWAVLRNDLPEYKEYRAKYPDEPDSIITTKMLLDRKSVTFEDEEDDGVFWELDLDKLIVGILKYLGEHEGFILEDDLDSESADVIIQYALFGELEYS